jgi:multicomponent Na+:H+ antiporter subunit D
MTPLEFRFAFVLLSPLLGVFLLPLKRRNRFLFFFLISLLPIANTFLVLNQGLVSDSIRFGIFSFSLDRFSFLFATLLNVCWLVTIIYASDFVRYHFQKKARTFYGLMSVAVSLITGAGTSDNLFTLYFFYLLSIPAIFPLVTLRDGVESREAGRWYMYSTLGPALLIALPVLFYVGQWFVPFQQVSIRQVTESDTVASLILAGFIVGFSKNCVAPFWGWLPRTSIAPAPVSALIHSVGAVHMGTIAILKIIVYLYGFDYMSRLSLRFEHTGWLIYLCGGTALYTAICAYRSVDLKKRFSYSTVGQLSYVITAGLVGTPGALLGATLHIATHSVAKMSLFFVVGTFNSVYGTVNAKEVAKIIPHVRWLAIPVAISGLSITGFPFLAGYYSKDLMLLEEIAHHQYAAAAFLIAGSVLNFLYIFPVLRAACRKTDGSNFNVKPIPFGIRLALVANTLLVVALSIFTVQITRTLN